MVPGFMLDDAGPRAVDANAAERAGVLRTLRAKKQRRKGQAFQQP